MMIGPSLGLSREEASQEETQGIGGLDFLSHLFSFFVHLHVFLGIVRQVGIAVWKPRMQQLLSLDIQLFLGNRQIETKDLQGVGDRWGNLGHIRKSDNRSISLSMS